jgi:hypothetical protein
MHITRVGVSEGTMGKVSLVVEARGLGLLRGSDDGSRLVGWRPVQAVDGATEI